MFRKGQRQESQHVKNECRELPTETTNSDTDIKTGVVTEVDTMDTIGLSRGRYLALRLWSHVRCAENEQTVLDAC